MHKRRTVYAAVVIAVVSAAASAVPGRPAAAASTAACVPLTATSVTGVPLSAGLSATSTSYDAEGGVTAGAVTLPSGWSPLTASASDLSALGFPARPTDAAGLAEWNNTYRNFKGADPSTSTQLCQGSVRYGLLGHKSTGNYIGIEDTNNTYNGAFGSFALAATNMLVCPHSSTANFWVGTTDNSTIDQGGIAFDPSNSTGYQFWEELFPLSPLYFNNGQDMPWSAGQSIQLTDSYATDSGGHFTFNAYNVTTGLGYILFYTNAASYYRNQNAEFVSEQIETVDERKFGAVHWVGAKAVYSNHTQVNPGVPGYYIYNGPFGTESAPSGDSFTMTWSSCDD